MSSSKISSNDRFSMTLFMAAALHAIVILGVGIDGMRERPSLPPLMELTLTNTPTEELQEDYDFLAPDDQEGGGSAEEAMRPSPPSSLVPDPRDMQDDLQVQPAPSEAAADQDSAVVMSRRAWDSVERSEEDQPQPEPDRSEPEETQLQVARDLTDPSHTINWDARYPSKQRINASTRSHAAAAYMMQWIERVEQIGNLNYPDEARARQLTGQLVLEVTLLPDGTVESVRILEPSRYRLLDDAAIRVVEMAAPYPEVPKDVLAGNSRLVITRTWEFVRNQELQAR